MKNRVELSTYFGIISALSTALFCGRYKFGFALLSMIAVFIILTGCTSQKFAIYQFDNGDDYLCEGLRRVVDKSGKIGFADEKGKIVISPRFAFAFPFENGLSKATYMGQSVADGEHYFWESPHWFYINHKGDSVVSDRSVEIKKNVASIESRLKSLVAEKNARIGIAVIIDGKDTVAVNGNRDFPMMSVFKFPLALAVVSWLEANGMSLDDYTSFGPDALKEDTWSPMLEKYGRRLTKMTYRELLEWALTESDNNATDILLMRVGGPQCALTLLNDVSVSAGITIGATEEDMHRDPYLSYLNRSTPLAMATLFDRFDSEIRGRSQSFSGIAEMLERCRTGQDRLPAPLTGDNSVIGHKTGTGFTSPDGKISALNDCGYVHLPNGTRYTIAVFIADSGYDITETSQIIADISAIVYNELK